MQRTICYFIIVLIFSAYHVFAKKRLDFSACAGSVIDSNVLNTLNIDDTEITTLGAIKGIAGISTGYLIHDCGSGQFKPSISIETEKYISDKPSVYKNDNAAVALAFNSGFKGKWLNREYKIQFVYAYQYVLADIDQDHMLEFNRFDNIFTPTFSYQVFGKNVTAVSFPFIFYLNRFENGENDSKSAAITLKQNYKFKDFSSHLVLYYGEYDSKNDEADNRAYSATLKFSYKVWYKIATSLKLINALTTYNNKSESSDETFRSLELSASKEIKNWSPSVAYVYSKMTGGQEYTKSEIMIKLSYSM